MYKKGDFHLHTNASDGKCTPEGLVKLAKNENIDIIAITDHDTTEALERAIETGLQTGIKVIGGIELSTLYNKESVHVLGYFKGDNYKDSFLLEYLRDMQNYRKERAKKIIEKLDMNFNIKLDYDKLVRNNKGILARPHIAKAIIEAGYDYSFPYIFSNFIGSGCPAYVPTKKLSTEDGVKLLRKFNCVVVLAHPVLIKNTNIEELMQLDFDGIEAIYYLNKEEDTERFVRTAGKYHKIITAGSDFHGILSDGENHAPRIGAVHLDGPHIKAFLDLLESK